MNLIQTNYSGLSDQQAMIQLAQALRADYLHVTDLPYRLSSWAMDDPANASLWWDEDNHLLAWAVLQAPFWTIDYVYAPSAEADLHPHILFWADQRARTILDSAYGHPSWYVNVFADQVSRRHFLEQNGFANQAGVGQDSWSKVWMELEADTDLPNYPPPKGFSLRSLAGEAEVDGYVELHRAVFETKNMTREWRLRTLKQPGYLPELDMVATDPDGRLAAFCIGWLSRGTGYEMYGQIEPLGCHPDFRSYALGRVVLCETIRRLYQLGASHIFVETDNYRNTAFRLYESVGFKVVRDVLVYRKDYNQPEG